MKKFTFSTVFALLVTTQIGRADPLDTWTLRYTASPPSTVYNILYANDQFIAVGDRGTILTSAEGLNWAQRQSGTTNLLEGVAYGNGQFVAVGYKTGPPNQYDGTIVSSRDGVNWVLHQSVTGHPLSAIAYGNGRFVAVGDSILMTSADGVNWTERPSECGEAITFGSGQFVAVGYCGILTSFDGANWTTAQSGSMDALFGIAYGKGMFVAVGGRWINKYDGLDERIIVTSTDGVNWVQRESETNNGIFHGVAYGNGQFVAVGYGPIVTSSDGLNWTQHQLWNAEGITFGNGHFLVQRDGVAILQSGSITNDSLPYDAIYCFGFSWTCTSGIYADGSIAIDASDPQYWQARTSNGPMWPEFLSASLGIPYVPKNNYARDASDGFDVLSQISRLSIPTNMNRNVFFVWDGLDILFAADANLGGSFSGDVSYVNWANEAGWNTVVQRAVRNSSNAVERLYAKGARAIVLQNFFDMSLFPVRTELGDNTNRLPTLTAHTSLFNLKLAIALEELRHSKPDLRLYLVDNFSHLYAVQTNTAQYGFTVVFPDALDDPALTDKSFTGGGKDYLYWDNKHPTSKLHELIAGWNLEVLTDSVLETLETSVSQSAFNLQMNHLLPGRAYVLQRSSDLTTWQAVSSFATSAGTNQWSSPLGSDPAGYFRLSWQR